MMERIKTTCAGLWCHRAVYAGLAVATGAGWAGWLDGETVKSVAFGCYLALAAQRH